MALSLRETCFELLVGEVEGRELQRSLYGCHIKFGSCIIHTHETHIGVVAASLRTHIGVILCGNGRFVVAKRSASAAVNVVLLRSASVILQILKSIGSG